jgi:hypothetical protein
MPLRFVDKAFNLVRIRLQIRRHDENVTASRHLERVTEGTAKEREPLLDDYDKLTKLIPQLLDGGS